MKDPNTTPPDDSWESDAVWRILAQAPPRRAPDRFTENTVRAARLLEEVKPWWSRLFSPAQVAGLAGATAALTIALLAWFGPAPNALTVQDSAQAVAIEDIAAADTLLAAADHLDEFSDSELVSLIGF